MTKRIFNRRHIRLLVGTLSMALVIATLSAPTAVQSVARPDSINAPANLTVTSVSNTGVSLSWNAVVGAVNYQIERSDTMSGPFRTVGKDITGTTFTDSTVTTPNAYVYRARTIGVVFQTGEVLNSPPSNMAVGTAISFQFSQVSELQGKTITAQQFYDVRTAINSIRKVAHLPAIQWSPSVLNGQFARATHVQDLRAKLNEALTALQIPVLSFQDPSLPIGTVIRAIHLEQLQTRSTRGSSITAGPLYHNASRAEVGEFGPVISVPLVPVHLSLLPDRRVLFWGRDFVRDMDGDIVPTPSGEAKQVVGHSDAYVWSVMSTPMPAPSPVPNQTANLFCSGHSFLPDGRLFVSGGHAHEDYDALGETQTNIFDYRNNTWTRGTDMAQGRWYPYHVTLGTGEPLIFAGSYWSNPPNTPPSALVNLVPQVYVPAFETTYPFKNLATPPQSRLSVYPFIDLLSDGTVFQAQSGFTRVNTQIVPDQQSRYLDPAANVWGTLPTTLKPHAIGSAVFLGNDKMMLVGGFDTGNEPTNGVEVITVNPKPSAAWTEMAPMKFKRTYHTATMLPDGKVLVTGGVSCPGGNNIQSYDGDDTIKCSSGQVMNAELWDPATNTWTTMAAQQEIRAYHSIAALLPDGRVLVGGGGNPGAVGETGIEGDLIKDRDNRNPNAMGFGHNNVEIYSPPYLFNANGTLATRPTITSYPQVLSYGDLAFIGTSGAGAQPKVSLIRLPSVTHGFNQDQRMIALQPTLFGSGLFVTIPSSSNELPPGPYMLFVLNSSGVPSLAEIVRVQHESLFPSAIPATTGSGAGSTWEQGVEFSSTVDGQITHIRFWKAAGEPSGNHTGRIWNADTHVQLAAAIFTNETASGWQEAQLQTPLQITKGVRYKVTYNIHSVVAKTFDVFSARPITSGVLVSYGASFSTPAGTFPMTGSTSNLFADIVFR
ncbi:MAG TPA: DUF4082 domain-containing protein [Pyrinomonadaceae bacterium]|nr:DUF4082 domain-containing protein [Pyrinomonadaceae bacterium]